MLLNLFNFVATTTVSKDIQQIMIFNKDGDEFTCNITLEPAVGVEYYYIFTQADVGKNNARAIHEGKAEYVKGSGNKVTYQLEIPIASNKVKTDGSLYSFKLDLTTPYNSKSEIFTESFAWDSSNGQFEHSNVIRIQFYKSWLFWVMLGIITLIVCGIVMYSKMRKNRIESAEDEL